MELKEGRSIRSSITHTESSLPYSQNVSSYTVRISFRFFKSYGSHNSSAFTHLSILTEISTPATILLHQSRQNPTSSTLSRTVKISLHYPRHRQGRLSHSRHDFSIFFLHRSEQPRFLNFLHQFLYRSKHCQTVTRPFNQLQNL